MADFLESAKNLVNSAVSRTSWEAQKQLRVRGKQGEIDKLVEQRQQLMDDLGQVVLNLYQQGNLTDAQLSRLCASIFELDHDLRTRETQLQEIKNEAYPVNQFAAGPTTDYSPPPVSPNPSSSSSYAPYGGSSSSTGTAGASNTAGSVKCPQCGNFVRANSAYCRSCGAKLH